jgi:preprotein translocase subunit YajC
MIPCLAQDQPQGGGGLQMLFLLAAMGLIWWFLVFNPQRKAEKARRAKLDAIQKGDRVRTRGGIEGVVVRVQDDTVTLKIDTEGRVHVPFAKPYIEDVLANEPAAATESK